MGVEKSNVTLTCLFEDSIPPVNNVTFYENGKLILLVSYCIVSLKRIILKYFEIKWFC